MSNREALSQYWGLDVALLIADFVVPQRNSQRKIFYFFLLFVFYFSIAPALASAQSMSSVGSVQRCRDSELAIERELVITKQLQTELTALNDDIELRLTPFKVCQDQTMVYVPGHALANSQGCLDPRTLEGPRGPAGSQGQSGRNVTCYR